MPAGDIGVSEREIGYLFGQHNRTTNRCDAIEKLQQLGGEVLACSDSSGYVHDPSANMPCTPEAVQPFASAGVAFAPAKAANAGGVATSALEMQQNASRDSWSFEETEQRLRQIMRDIHDACRRAAEQDGVPGDYLAGANITGFERVAAAMPAHGVV